MNHQPFETWIYDSAELTEVQSTELSIHLDACSQCQKQKIAWRRVEKLLVSSPLETAPNGFTLRFQSSLSSRLTQQQRRQSAILLISLICAFLLILSIVLGILLVEGSLSSMVTAMFRFISNAPERWLKFRYIASFWLSNVPSELLFFSGLVLSGTALVLLSTWTFTLTRIQNIGGVQNE